MALPRTQEVNILVDNGHLLPGDDNLFFGPIVAGDEFFCVQPETKLQDLMARFGFFRATPECLMALLG